LGAGALGFGADGVGLGAGLVGSGVALDSQEVKLAPPLGAPLLEAPPPGAPVGDGAGAAEPPPVPADGLTPWHRTACPAAGMTQHRARWPIALQVPMKLFTSEGAVGAVGVC